MKKGFEKFCFACIIIWKKPTEEFHWIPRCSQQALLKGQLKKKVEGSFLHIAITENTIVIVYFNLVFFFFLESSLYSAYAWEEAKRKLLACLSI